MSTSYFTSVMQGKRQYLVDIEDKALVEKDLQSIYQ